MEMDVGARPHELLNRRIKDVKFIETDSGKYAEILVNGKTGQRSLVLTDSIPYVTQWIPIHKEATEKQFCYFIDRNSEDAISQGNWTPMIWNAR
jgi:hypothetical protein